MSRYPLIAHYRYTLQQSFNTPILYTIDTQFQILSINIRSISFFPSSYMHQSHHLLGCHTTSSNSSFSSFLSSLRFSNLVCNPENHLHEIIIKINVTKIYIKSFHSITIECDIARTFVKLEYIFICIKSSKKFFNYFTCNNPIRNKF